MFGKAIFVFAAAISLIYADATSKEKLLSFFTRIEGKNLLSGSFGGFSNISSENRFSLAYAEGIYNLTNQYPAIYGMNCGTKGAKISKPGKEEDLVECFDRNFLQYYKDGGILTLGHVIPNPLLPGNDPHNETIDGHRVPITNEQYQRLLVEGTPERNYLYRIYDKIAEGLAQYQAEGVPVIYRPYIEMNGEWFWWGNTAFLKTDKERQELFKELWRDLYYYFTNHRGFDNLIWVYTPSEFREYKTDFYPGDDYVDMVGMSVYQVDFRYATGYDEMVSLGKPMAFPEVGPFFDERGTLPFGKLDYGAMVDTINTMFPKVIYFASWNSFQGPLNNDNAWGAFNNYRVLNRGDFSI